MIFRRTLFYLLILFFPCFCRAQQRDQIIEVYGFIMTDAGYNFNTIDPNWFDVMRPTKLPSYPNQFGPNGSVYYSIRQTRLGVGSSVPTALGDFKTQFDFDLFGFGPNIGETKFHMINAFGQIGRLTVGQTASVFMDQAVMPVTLDYWGPSSRVFMFVAQVRYVFLQKQNDRIMVALEKPGATADGGDEANSISLQPVKPFFRVPNLTANYRHLTDWGQIQVSGVLKSIQWKDLSDTSQYDLSGKTIGWGFNLGTVVNASQRLRLKLQGVFGSAIGNYIADSPPDIGAQSNPGDPSKPIKGAPLSTYGFFSFAELKWSEMLSSTVGYSLLSVKNSDLQSSNAFREGQYALLNLRYYPATNAMVGIEYQYGRRDNFTDHFYSTANKVQFSLKYTFSTKNDNKK